MSCLLAFAWCTLAATTTPPQHALDESFAVAAVEVPVEAEASRDPVTPDPESDSEVPTRRWPLQFEIVPHVGMYMSLGHVVDGQNVELRKRHVGAALVGARLGVPLNHRLELEASVGYSPSMVARTDQESTIDYDAAVYLANAKAVYCLSHCDRMGRWTSYVGLGAGAVHRSGPAWLNTANRTSFAGVLAAGARVHIGKGINARIELEDYVNRPDTRDGTTGATNAGSMVHDMVWSFGVSIDLMNR